MAIDPLNIWKSTLAALPPIDTPIWPTPFANWYADRIVNIAANPTFLSGTPISFTFNTAVFIAGLSAAVPTDNSLVGITFFASAWEAAVLASIVVAFPGSYIPPPTPATTFSAVATTIIDPASILAGKSKILELASSPLVDNALESEFPEKFRDATLLLTITVSGTNSVAPTPGPLVAAGVGLV